MLKIGVTGNIGAGKTEVCRIFEVLNIPVYYADPRARTLMVEDTDLVLEIKRLFGDQAYDDSGELNRKYIAELVFNDEKILRDLNALVHPVVGRDFNRWVKEQNASYCIKEAALLFEAGSYRQLDEMILVVADEQTRLSRVMVRDNTSEKEVRNRMDKQMSQEEKIKLSDHIIDNNGQTGLVAQVLKLHQRFISLNR